MLEFNRESTLERNPRVGYKIQDVGNGPRVILFTKHSQTTLEECIDVARDVVKDHLRARSYGRKADTDVLVNYKGTSFSVKPRMTEDESLRAYKTAKHRQRVGRNLRLISSTAEPE
jgi:hypothetical protein